MLVNKNHHFISMLEEQCAVEQLISNIGIENTVIAVELIKIPTGSVSFMSNIDNEKEIIIVIGGCGTVSDDERSGFIKPGEITPVAATTTTRSLSNIDERLLQVISIRYKIV